MGRAISKIKIPESVISKVKERANEEAFVHLRSLFGNNWAEYFALLGARQAGKSYCVMKLILNSKRDKGDKVKCFWIRLTEKSASKLLQTNAKKLVDPDLVRKYRLNLSVETNMVYNVKEDGEKELLLTVLDLSTFYNDKGSAYFDKDFDGEYIIVCDEMNREKSEKNTFDIVYNFKNQLENIIRNSGSKEAKAKRVRVILIGNTLSEASDMLLAFGFLPEPGEFGRYKLRSKRCIIDYLPLTDAYKRMREGSTVDILQSSDESTFKNEVRYDKSLINKARLSKPNVIIKFKDDTSTWFTLWENGTITRYNKEKRPAIAMRRYIQGEAYQKPLADNIIAMFDTRSFKFDSFYTQETFRKELRLLKPQR